MTHNLWRLKKIMKLYDSAWILSNKIYSFFSHSTNLVDGNKCRERERTFMRGLSTTKNPDFHYVCVCAFLFD